MTIKPQPGKVVVQLDAKLETSPGGLYLPEDARKDSTQGVVIATGKIWYDSTGSFHKIELDEGDRVLLGKWAGVDVTLHDVDYVVLQHTDILAVLDPACA